MNNRAPDRSAVVFPEIILPWDIDLKSARWQWAINFIATRSFYDQKVWKVPTDAKMAQQVEKLLPYFYGSRNFIVCFSSSPSYIRNMYLYLAATWSLTTRSRAEVADIQDLIQAVFEREESLESYQEADLLMLPYADRDHMGLNKARGSISNMLMRRRAQNLPTVTDLYVGEKPQGEKWWARHAKRLTDIYGTLAFDLFYGDRAKCVYVSGPADESVREEVADVIRREQDRDAQRVGSG